MYNLLRRLYTVRYNYENPLDMQRAQGLLIVTEALLALWVFWTLLFAISSTGDAPLASTEEFLPTVLIVPLLLIVYGLVQTGRLRAASWLVVIWLFGSVAILNLDGFDSLVTTFMVLPLVLAGLLLGRVGTTVILGLFVVYVGVSASIVSDITELQIRDRAGNVPINIAIISSALVFISATLYAFGGAAQNIVKQWLDYVRQYNAVNRFSRNAENRDEFALYQDAIEMLRQEFGFVFVQVYLSDEDGTISRRVQSSGIVTNDQPVTGVAVADASVLSEAARRNETVIVTPYDGDLRRRHLLPSVSIGLAVPFTDGEKVLGVLDLQTSQKEFGPRAIQVVEAFADQLGGIVRALRVINNLRQTVREQEATNAKLRQQIQQMQQGVVQENSTWTSYMQQRGTKTLGFDFDAGEKRVNPAGDLPDHLRDALKDGQVRVESHADGQTMLIPIMLKGEVLGAMSFDAKRITERQRETAQQVANRLALALENKRLFEQSQAQANRERRAGEAADLLISATEVDAVLNLAATTFNEALGAVQTRIHLSPEVMAQGSATEGH